MQQGMLSPPGESRVPGHAGVFKGLAAGRSRTARTARRGSGLGSREGQCSPGLVACEHSTTLQAGSASLGSFAVGHDIHAAPLCANPQPRARLRALSAGWSRPQAAPGGLSALSRCLSPARTG